MPVCLFVRAWYNASKQTFMTSIGKCRNSYLMMSWQKLFLGGFEKSRKKLTLESQCLSVHVWYTASKQAFMTFSGKCRHFLLMMSWDVLRGVNVRIFLLSFFPSRNLWNYVTIYVTASWGDKKHSAPVFVMIICIKTTTHTHRTLCDPWQVDSALWGGCILADWGWCLLPTEIYQGSNGWTWDLALRLCQVWAPCPAAHCLPGPQPLPQETWSSAQTQVSGKSWSQTVSGCLWSFFSSCPFLSLKAAGIW